MKFYMQHDLRGDVVWHVTEFFDLNDETLNIAEMLVQSSITSITMYPISETDQYLYLTVENVFTQVSSFLKITISNEKIENIVLITVKQNKQLKLVGAADVNNDGLIDIIFTDSFNNVSA